MPTLHIYFNDELFLLIKNEENRSELIAKLLLEYYGKIKKKVRSKEEIAQEMENLKLELATKEKQFEELTEQERAIYEKNKRIEQQEADRAKQDIEESKVRAQLRAEFTKLNPEGDRHDFDEWLINNHPEEAKLFYKK